MSTSMRSLLSTATGGPETLSLHHVAIPQPAPGEVLVRVRAVSANYPDLLIIEDKYQDRPHRPFAPGSEVAGTVQALGAEVTTLKPGQNVMAMTGWGGMAEYVCVPETKCTPCPPSMPFDDAASFLVTYGTSYHALKDRARLQPGETLLVLGAAGGVGLAAVELGKAMGARVVAAASSEAKLEAARAAGADETMIYPATVTTPEEQKLLAAAFKTACGGGGADVIYDPVGGGFSEPALRSIAWKGRFLVVGFPAGIAQIPLNLALLKGCDIVGVYWGRQVGLDPKWHRQAVAELVAFYEAGKIKPRIHARFPLEEGAQALALLASRGVSGKVVVTVD